MKRQLDICITNENFRWAKLLFSLLEFSTRINNAVDQLYNSDGEQNGDQVNHIYIKVVLT